jgi:glycosyltransferase involved in cell wall biosynthesis
MNILHVEASSGWGGQEIRILRESLAMRDLGHCVVLCVQTGGALIAKARAQNLLVYEVDFRKSKWLKTFFRLRKIIKKHSISLINTHSSLDSWIGGIAGRIMGCKILRTRHLSANIKKGLNSKILYGYLADYVITTCKSIIPMIALQSGKSLQQMQSIATGVDPEKIQTSKLEVAAFRQNLCVSDSDILVGTVCFLRSWKGIQDFLKAAYALKDDVTIKWVIIGGGHIETYKKMALDMGLEKIVHFVGHLEVPYSAIKALDIFCLLSTANEGISQAMLQAAFLQKPLIATPTGGLSEVCIDKETGIEVACHSHEAVVNAIKTLQNNPYLRQTFGENAKKLVEKQFTFKTTIEETTKVYEQIFHLDDSSYKV